MTSDNKNNKETEDGQSAADLSIDEIYREKSRARNRRRRLAKTLDQCKSGLELIAYYVDDVEAAMKQLLIMRLESKGGQKTLWEKWCKKLDLNWNNSMVDGRGNPLFNHPNDMNLFNVADMALRVTFESKTLIRTLTQTMMHLGNAFSNHCFRAALLETREGDRLQKGLGRMAQLDTNNQESRRDRIHYYAKKSGYHEEDWAEEEEVFRCGTFLWNAVVIGTGIFHQDLDDLNESKWDAYFVTFRPEIQAELDARDIQLDDIPTYYGPTDYVPTAYSKHEEGSFRDIEMSRGAPIVRNASAEHLAEVIQMQRQNDFDLPQLCLNLLAQVPLNISPDVLAALEWVPRSYERVRKVKDFPNTKEVPTRYTKEQIANFDKKQRRAVKHEERKRHSDNRAAKGNRSQIKNWISTAKFWLERGTPFWLHYSFDTRGRVYHIGDFGHHNVDCLRAIFQFANKKPIGKNIDKLYLSLANHFGVDKLTIEDRVAWAKRNEEIIIAAGRVGGTEKKRVYGFRDEKTEYEYFMPETLDDGSVVFVSAGRHTPFDFWAKAGFQFLAACQELAKLRDWQATTGFPESEFYSGLPVAADATQSGIQHYSLASRNYDDGLLTNVVPQDRPNDLYQVVLERAKVLFQEKLTADRIAYNTSPLTDDEKQIIADFENLENDEDVEWEELKAARDEFKKTTAYIKNQTLKEIDAVERLLNWDGYNRSVTKRNTMCFAYSSVAYGMSDQIMTDTMNPLALQVRLEEIDEHPFGPDMGFTAATVMGTIHYQAIREIVQSAAAGMDYFQSCSDLLHQFNLHFGYNTKWGFPVRQNYRVKKTNPKRPLTWLYDFTIAEKLENQPDFKETDAIKRRSQSLSLVAYTDDVEKDESRQAIAPNCIHSLDALLLQMTVVTCSEQNVRDMLCVHDSFATTIADADTMDQCVRLATVDLYHEYDVFAAIHRSVMDKIRQWAADKEPEQLLAQVKDIWLLITRRARNHDRWLDVAEQLFAFLQKHGIRFNVKNEETGEVFDEGNVDAELLVAIAEFRLTPRPDPETGKLNVPDVMQSRYYVS
jgi:DNA-directed RNA polymerase